MEVKFTKKVARISLLVMAMFIFAAQTVFAQRAPIVGDFKSAAIGDWNSPTTWQVYMGVGGKAGWVNGADMPAGQQLPNATSDVFVTRGLTVTLSQSGACKNLYISTVDANGVPKANVEIGSNTLDVSGKLSGFVGVPGTNATPGTIAGSVNPASISTNATGKVKFTGLTRNIIEAGEWSENSNNFNVEIALNSNETATLGRAFGLQNLEVTSGTFDSSNKAFYAEGNITVAANAGFASLSSAPNQIVSNLAGGNGGTFNLNGTLTLKGASPSFGMTTVNFNGGTVVYNGGGAPQNLIVSHNGAPVVYNNLSLFSNQDKLVSAASAITVNGALYIDAISNIVLNGGQLNLNGTVTGTGKITSDAAASIAVGGTGNAGTIYFTTGSQIVKQLTINRGTNGSVTLGTPLTITETLTLTNGVINSDATKVLTLSDNATVAGGNVASYVAGPLARNLAVSGVATQLYFPVGKGNSYNPITLTMTHSSAGTNTYTAEQFNTAPASRELPITIQSVSATRYFSIHKTGTATISTGVVALNYGSDEGITDGSAVRIVKSSNTTEPWIDLGRSAVSSTTSTGTVISTMNFTSFSDFAIAKAVGGPLPVELVSFDAKAMAGQVQLNWATATELNNDYFVIERSATVTGESFKAIATVKGNGTTATIKTYSASDKQPLSGTSYYRLKQVDLDGTVAYSKLVAVSAKGNMVALSVYPNPAKDNLTVRMPEATEKATVTIVNTLGQVVIAKTVNIVSGDVLNLEVAALPAGAYQVQVINQNGNASAKFIKTVN